MMIKGSNSLLNSLLTTYIMCKSVLLFDILVACG